MKPLTSQQREGDARLDGSYYESLAYYWRQAVDNLPGCEGCGGTKDLSRINDRGTIYDTCRPCYDSRLSYENAHRFWIRKGVDLCPEWDAHSEMMEEARARRDAPKPKLRLQGQR